MRFLMILMTGLIVGCATASNTKRLSLGMTKPEVINVMGEPDSVAAQGGAEYLEFQHLERIGHYEYFYVRLVNGRTDSFGRKGDFGTTKTPDQTLNLNVQTKAD